MDITKEWANTQNKKGSVTNRQFYTVNGVKYEVDNKHITLKPSSKEISIADTLSQKYGKNIELVPQIVYPQNIQTPDYIIDGERFDLKSPTGKGKDVLRDLIKRKKKQSPNFIFDLTDCPLTDEDVERQVTSIFSWHHTRFVDKIVIMKGNNILKVYKKD